MTPREQFIAEVERQTGTELEIIQDGSPDFVAVRSGNLVIWATDRAVRHYTDRMPWFVTGRRQCAEYFKHHKRNARPI